MELLIAASTTVVLIILGMYFGGRLAVRDWESSDLCVQRRKRREERHAKAASLQ